MLKLAGGESLRVRLPDVRGEEIETAGECVPHTPLGLVAVKGAAFGDDLPDALPGHARLGTEHLGRQSHVVHESRELRCGVLVLRSPRTNCLQVTLSVGHRQKVPQAYLRVQASSRNFRSTTNREYGNLETGMTTGGGSEQDLLAERRRRLVAARTLAGLGQVELAQRIKTMGHPRGYSARTIGDMERGETPIQPQAIPILAAACRVSPAFFTVDFATLASGDSELPTMDDLERLRSEIRAEQVGRANLESALQELLGEDLRLALAEVRRR